MNATWRATLGYAALGFVVGIFILPWFLVWGQRSGTATVGDPMWLVWNFLVVVLPVVVFSIVGWNRSRASGTPT